MFVCGLIEDLWQEARSVRSWPPQTAPNDIDIDKSVQDAADKDNYCSAYARAVKAVPICPINWKNKQSLLDKYPDRQHINIPPLAQPPTNGPDLGMFTQPTPLATLPGDIIMSICCQNKGRANGLFMDSLDLFIRLVNIDCPKINQSLRLFYTRIYNGRVPKCIEAYFINTYLFCLSKDEKDPTKLRPIGVPTAIRRIITNHLAKYFRRRFARDLLPFNFAVGIDNGMDFVVKSLQLTMEKYITNPQSEGKAPSRAFISLDLANMFNEISRDYIFNIVTKRYPDLLPSVTRF